MLKSLQVKHVNICRPESRPSVWKLQRRIYKTTGHKQEHCDGYKHLGIQWGCRESPCLNAVVDILEDMFLCRVKKGCISIWLQESSLYSGHLTVSLCCKMLALADLFPLLFMHMHRALIPCQQQFWTESHFQATGLCYPLNTTVKEHRYAGAKY